nr:histone H1.a, hepatic - rat (fragments) [Rattus norvegicus]
LIVQAVSSSKERSGVSLAALKKSLSKASTTKVTVKAKASGAAKKPKKTAGAAK